MRRYRTDIPAFWRERQQAGVKTDRIQVGGESVADDTHVAA
jgi:hypothetical protein